MQEPAKNVYEVQVAGLSLKLRSSHDARTVSELINLVDQKVKEAMDANASASFQNALILATLNLAEELMMLKRVASTEVERIEVRAQALLNQLEDASLDA